MLEVEEMADDYPRIVEENQRLEEKIQSSKYNINILKIDNKKLREMNLRYWVFRIIKILIQ